MAGHSHWARIKRAKAVTDARRGRAWSKLSRAIIVAARNGGGDPDANLALRYAIDAAKEANMPRDTIERAIKKGTGELGAETYEDVTYEGYGPGGAAIMIRALTDNRHRTAGEIRNIFDNHGGKLGVTNCVAREFTKRGLLSIPKTAADEDTLTNIALETGADDVKDDGDSWELTCDPSVFEAVKAALAAAKIEPESAQVTMVAGSSVTLTGEKAAQMMKMIEKFEDHDDVQAVYSNFDISDDEMSKISG